MKRIKEEFLDKVESLVSLKEKEILEIGCGWGSRSFDISKRCKHLIAIDPNPEALEKASELHSADNIEYKLGFAEKLEFKDKNFDVVIFTLSIHHVPIDQMAIAITEAIRVTKTGGYVVFLEPAQKGTFFQAERLFDACDGDERKEIAIAYYSILNCKKYTEVAEIFDETIFQFDSPEDFIESLDVRKDKKQLPNFLKEHNYILNAERRINIFRV
jgi:ubiquinone/menaquinone biosynthesis C-methylase UbiE